MGEQLIVLAVLIAIGLIGVAIVRRVPAGSFLPGLIIMLAGYLLSLAGFALAVLAVLVAFTCLRTVLCAG